MTAVELRDIERGVDPASKVKLTATVVLGAVTIRFLRLVEGRNGPFVGMPSRKVGDAEFLDVVEMSDGIKSRVRDAMLAALSAPPAEVDEDDLPF